MAKWVNPERQAHLVKLFLESNGFCVHGLTPCKGEWRKREVAVCEWGKFCVSPMNDGEPCRYKPEEGKPHLPCHVHHAVRLTWHCAHGDYPCYSASLVLGQLGNPLWQGEGQYEEYIKSLIREWANESRSQAQAEWQAERKALHALGERREPVRGRFNALSREIILLNQPAYYHEGLGISGLTFKPFAKVRVSSSFVHLFIDLGDTLKPMSKNARRKAIRHGKPLPKAVDSRIDLAIRKAVRHHLNR